MDVLMFSAELSPYMAPTSAGQAVASLSKTLRQQGHEVTLVVPRDPALEVQGLLLARRLTPLALDGGGDVTVLDGQLASGVRLVAVDGPNLATAPDLLLARAGVALVRQRTQQGAPLDVLHGHDAAGALLVLALHAAGLGELPMVLTIHDGRRDVPLPASFGGFGASFVEGLRQAFGSLPEPVELALQKASGSAYRAVVPLAPAITTCSVSHAADLRRPQIGGGLADTLVEEDKSVIGVPHGIDYAVNNPATDVALESRFDAEEPSRKGICKAALLRKLGLELELERPLVVAAASLLSGGAGDTRGEAMTIMLEVCPQLLRSDLSLVVAGPMSPELREGFEKQVGRASDRLAILSELTHELARQAVAAADIALLTSPYEPCATSALLAQRYGAAPVLRGVGGALDAVVDVDAALESGTGFLYLEHTSEALLGAVQRAVAAYSTPAWWRLRRRMMRLDLAWDRPARRMLQIYRQVMSGS